MTRKQSSEQYRHQCEVRHLITQARERGRDWVRAYLDHKAVAGRQAKLRADVNEQRKLGNDGREGVWL